MRHDAQGGFHITGVDGCSLNADDSLLVSANGQGLWMEQQLQGVYTGGLGVDMQSAVHPSQTHIQTF
jgi:hypothetical protein